MSSSKCNPLSPISFGLGFSLLFHHRPPPSLLDYNPKTYSDRDTLTVTEHYWSRTTTEMLLKSHGHGDALEVVRPTAVVPCRRRSSTVAVLPLRTQICRVLPLRAWIYCRSPSSCMNMSLFSFFAQQTTTLFPAAATLRGLIKRHRHTACDLSLSLHDSTLPLSPMIVDLFLFPIFVYYILCLFLFLFLSLFLIISVNNFEFF